MSEVNLGERLKQIRKNLKLTQAEMAVKLGISPTALSKYENDERTPDCNFLANLLKIADIDIHWLLTGIPSRSDFVNDPDLKELIYYLINLPFYKHAALSHLEMIKFTNRELFEDLEEKRNKR